MAAVATMSNPLSGSSHHKITKARSKVVKPILKKLSHSEKNSLDLDRGWDEQPMSQYAWAGGYEPYGSGGRSAKDVSFSFGGSGESGFGSVGDMNMGMGQSLGGFGGGSGGAGRPGGYRHARSTSGTSYASVATSSSGGPRGGTFIHPFQQTPRTATPPLSHANSTISFEHNTAVSRDYSPTITEAEDSEDLVHVPTPSSFTAHSIHHHPHPASVSQSNLRRPSLASSQRTSSFSELAQSTVNLNGAPPLRVNTSRVFPPVPSSARQGRGKLTSSLSHSDLHLNYSDSPLSSTSTPLHHPPPPALISPSSSVSAMSPLRSSLEAFPRLRSRSELDTSQRAEHVREARRKFDERERLKEERRGREEEKRQHRRDMKEAKEIERISAAQVRKNSAAGAELLHGPTQRPATSRKSTSNNSITGILGHGRSKSNSHTGIGANDLAVTSSGHHNSSDNNTDEKLAFSSKKYDSVANGAAPQFGANVDDVRFVQGKRRTSSAKRKTQGVWTGIVLWVRTRLFRLGRK